MFSSRAECPGKVRRLAVALLATAFVAAGCSNDVEDTRLPITTTTVSADTTRDMSLLAPQAEGPWPVVYMLHGIGGDRHEMEQLGAAVARAGNVVFSLEWAAGEDMEALVELGCAYTYAQSIAADHGGDPSRAIAVAFSAGGTYALVGATMSGSEGLDGDAQPCTLQDGELVPPPDGGAPPPDVLVLIAPCLYEYEGRLFTTRPGGGNTDLRITVVSAENDTVCESWQQADGVEMLRDAGYEASLVSIPDATHLGLIYDADPDVEGSPAEEAEAGDRTTRAILEAIAATSG